jgi:AcrR family transcriptional regulator
MSKRSQQSAAPLPLSLAMRLAQNGILSAAVGVFTKKGAVATRVEDLLKAADVARRTFYKYFASKDDVLAALYDLATGELVRQVQAASEESGDPVAGLRQGIDVYLDYHASNAALVKILVEHAIPSDSVLAPIRRRFRGQCVELMASAAEKATGRRPDTMTCIALLGALECTSLFLVEDGAPSPAQIERTKKVMHRMLDSFIAAKP